MVLLLGNIPTLLSENCVTSSDWCVVNLSKISHWFICEEKGFQSQFISNLHLSGYSVYWFPAWHISFMTHLSWFWTVLEYWYLKLVLRIDSCYICLDGLVFWRPRACSRLCNVFFGLSGLSFCTHILCTDFCSLSIGVPCSKMCTSNCWIQLLKRCQTFCVVKWVKCIGSHLTCAENSH